MMGILNSWVYLLNYADLQECWVEKTPLEGLLEGKVYGDHLEFVMRTYTLWYFLYTICNRFH